MPRAPLEPSPANPELTGWAALTVGHQWPSRESLGLLRSASRDRRTASNRHESYADHLRTVRHGPLASQEGVTADDARDAFRSGEHHSSRVSERLAAVAKSYDAAHQTVAALRDRLADIAEAAEREIDSVNASSEPLPVKVAAVTDIVLAAQQEANAAAAMHGGAIVSEIQHVLNHSGGDRSAHHFLHDNAVASGVMSPSSRESIQSTVSQLITADAPNSESTVVDEAPAVGETLTSPTKLATASGAAAPTPGAPAATVAVHVPVTGGLAGAMPSGVPTEPTPLSAAPAKLNTVPAESMAAPLAVEHSAVTAPSPAAAAPKATLAPPASAPTATPLGPAASPTSAASSGLLAYGADLRPAATAAPGAPGSAPVHTSHTASGQMPAVRQQTALSAPATATAAAGITERAIASTHIDRAEARLRRLLTAVARQQPHLRWAVADFADGSTVVLTDLAGGWIPPGVQIPVGLRLMPPRPGSHSRATRLGDALASATYEPGDRLPPDEGIEAVPMSIRARDTTPVEDLGWELSRATKWRDGLPRLAHTLARAAAAGTGCTDAEIVLLREQVDAIAARVLTSYPDRVHPDEIANWQLLATVEALINDSPTLANYHFAWFRTHAPVSRGGGNA